MLRTILPLRTSPAPLQNQKIIFRFERYTPRGSRTQRCNRTQKPWAENADRPIDRSRRKQSRAAPTTPAVLEYASLCHCRVRNCWRFSLSVREKVHYTARERERERGFFNDTAILALSSCLLGRPAHYDIPSYE